MAFVTLDEGNRVAPVDGFFIRNIDANKIPNLMSVVGSGEDTTITATADIPAFAPVVASGVKANSGNTSHFQRVVGIAPVAILSGFSGSIVTDGTVTNLGWSWSVGVPIYINGNGVLSQTSPSTGFSQQIGVSTTANTIMVDLMEPILL